MIVKDGIVVYDHNVELRADAAYGSDFIDTTTRLDNASVNTDDTPQPFFGGWYAHNGSTISLTTNGLTSYKEHLIENLKKVADSIEYATILVDAKPIKTTLICQQYINGMFNTVQLNNTKIIDFVFADGSWAQLDKAAIELLATGVSDHVEACFTRRKVLQDNIMACTNLAELKLVETDLNTGWPDVENTEG